MEEPMIFDTHAHYDDAKFDGVREEILESLPQKNVCGVITCGCDGASSRAALALAEAYPFIYAAVGLHPENLASGTPLAEIEALAAHKKCVAIGEIGLDYCWNSENQAEQQAVFAAQLALANRLEMPVIVHDRDAHADTMRLLRQYRPKGVVHCFSGSVESARELVQMGLYIGIGGVVTFKNARCLPAVAAALPDDRILLETDCPYLAPEPFRGKLNRSDYIAETAEKIAEIRGIPVARLLALNRENVRRLFGV